MLKNSCNCIAITLSFLSNDNANAMGCNGLFFMEESWVAENQNPNPPKTEKTVPNWANQCAGWQKQESDLPISTNGGYEPELITLKCKELKVKSRASASKREGGRTRDREPKIQGLPKQSWIDANQDALVGKIEKALALQQGVILHENIIPIQATYCYWHCYELWAFWKQCLLLSAVTENPKSKASQNNHELMRIKMRWLAKTRKHLPLQQGVILHENIIIIPIQIQALEVHTYCDPLPL